MTATRTEKRQVRERELVAATRALFDERGVLDAPIEEIAKSVGIARGLVYRHFSSKDELYVATVCSYLADLGDALDSELAEVRGAVPRLERMTQTFGGFCERYPAFLDSSLALMHQPAQQLAKSVSEAVWFQLGQGMERCIGHVSAILHEGVEAGEFEVADPDYMANILWTQALGAMHLARIRVGLRSATPGVPELFRVEPDQVIASLVASALATVGAR